MTTPEPRRYHVAWCLVCEPVLPMPFPSAEQRADWCAKHVEGTGHAIVSIDEVLLTDPVLKALS